MLPLRITKKWRPSLLLVLGSVLAAVLAAPLLGFIAIGLLRDAMGFRQSVVLVSCVVVLITVVLGYVLWRLLLRPITALEDKALSLRSGDTSALSPLSQYGTRELHDLGQSVLDMATTLRHRETAIRTYTNHVTHELKTPITAIRGAAELLAATPQMDPDDARLVQTLLDASKRMEQQLVDLRKIVAAREPLHRGNTRLRDLIPELRNHFPKINLAATGTAILLPLSTEGLSMVLHQMIGNAQEHGAREVTLSAVIAKSGMELRISDDGSGHQQRQSGPDI